MALSLDWDDPDQILDWDNPPEKPIEITEPAPEVTQERATDLWFDFLNKYADDPVAFAEEVLQIELMPHQRRVLKAIANRRRRIAMRSGHRVGKTMLMAIICTWHYVCKYPQKTIVTAPTSGQLFNSLFPEIMTLSKKLPEWIREHYQYLSEEIRLKADPDGSFVVARTASPENGESFQGIHSQNVLFLWDEASGIDERLFNAARGSMAAPNAFQILAGNPVRLNNTFHRAFTNNSHLFETFHISSLGLPTVDPDFIQEVIGTFGADSNEYRVRILGEFPDTEDESYIAAPLVRAARTRDIKPVPLSAVVYGVDPARMGGDKTVITRRRGQNYFEDQITLTKKNTMEVVGHIVDLAERDRNALIEEYKQAGRSLYYLPPVPAAIVVDVIGIGAGVVDRLVELGYNVIAVNASETSTAEPLCARVRDVLWKKGREWFESGLGRIPDNDMLQQEITVAHYTFNSAGVLKIESKDEMRKPARLGRSPDLADSFFLSLMVPETVFTEFTKGVHGAIGYGSGPKGSLSRASSSPTALSRSR